MIRRSLFTFLAGMCLLPAHAQIPGLPDSLLRNSDAVCRLMSVDFIYSSPTSAVTKIVEETTILNNTATHKGNFTCYVSPTTSLKSFSGTLCDASGKLIRKLKRGDLKYTEFSAGNLAIDAATYYMEVYAPTYPYTVRYEYELADKDGILGFPSFIPVSSGTSLQKGVYTVSVPASTQFGYKCLNIGEPEKTTADGRDVYRWTLTNVPALKSEPARPPLLDLLPAALTAPHDFIYEKTQGSMRDWASYGVWQCSLLEGRDQLPDALKQEVHRRTDHLTAPRDKVKALYDYMGETTRYVSIQLGIGGQQPASAAEVFRTKFGDCKALSNYLHAMLAACDIESFYTIIHTQNKHIPRDFATPAIANHAILGVPCQRDTLWLECTNTDVPFGYVHQSIAGHDAVICHDGKAEVVTLPAYADSLNTECQRIDVRLDEAGNASLSLSSVSRARQYEWTRPILDLARDKQADFLRRSFQLPLAQVDSLRCEEVLDKPLPEMHIRASITALRYANKTGSRLFVPVAPLRSGPGRFTTCLLYTSPSPRDS